MSSRLRAIGKLLRGAVRGEVRALAGTENYAGTAIIGAAQIGDCATSPEHAKAVVDAAPVDHCFAAATPDLVAKVGRCWTDHHARIGE